MDTFSERRRSAIVLALMAALAGCTSYVKQDQFDSTVTELRTADQKLQTQIDALSQKHDTLAKEVAIRIRIDTGAGFATGDATLGEEDKPFLSDFAKAIALRPDAVVTVEGFADPQGPTAYNYALGERRAQAVAEYLANSGMSTTQLRAVSYGEAKNRQVRLGQIGEAGSDNRRLPGDRLLQDHERAHAGVAGDPRAAASGRTTHRAANGRHVRSVR